MTDGKFMVHFTAGLLVAWLKGVMLFHLNESSWSIRNLLTYDVQIIFNCSYSLQSDSLPFSFCMYMIVHDYTHPKKGSKSHRCNNGY